MYIVLSVSRTNTVLTRLGYHTLQKLARKPHLLFTEQHSLSILESLQHLQLVDQVQRIFSAFDKASVLPWRLALEIENIAQ